MPLSAEAKKAARSAHDALEECLKKKKFVSDIGGYKGKVVSLYDVTLRTDGITISDANFSYTVRKDISRAQADFFGSVQPLMNVLDKIASPRLFDWLSAKDLELLKNYNSADISKNQKSIF